MLIKNQKVILEAQHQAFGGHHCRYSHWSDALNCKMFFSLFLPPRGDEEEKKFPVLYWLSGLTCTDENFSTKSGAQRVAMKLGIALLIPDTSPRGDDVADDDANYAFGQGAGFYVNATVEPWKQHYQMYSYIASELPALVKAHFPVNDMWSIAGHSMGGHGALVIALRNSERFVSASAFAPIASPANCSWGQRAFEGYLGKETNHWLQYDACNLIASSTAEIPMLIDQGSEDEFLEEQLNTERLIEVCKEANYPAEIRYQEGYDHSYYFVASFIEEHLNFHSHYLKH